MVHKYEELTIETLSTALKWYQAMGVSWLVQDDPCEWIKLEGAAFDVHKPASAYASSQNQRVSSSKTLDEQPLRPQLSALTPNSEVVVDEANRLAQSAGDLNALRGALQSFEGSALKHTARSLVFSDGNPKADLMVIGLMPNRDDDVAGQPFVGKDGQLLDRMLAAIHQDRSNTYLMNLLPWRPPGNRLPTPEEINLLKPFALRHIALVRPKVILCLGDAPARVLGGDEMGVFKNRGRRFDYQDAGMSIPSLWTFHPSFLLKQAQKKAESWRDLLVLKQSLLENAG